MTRLSFIVIAFFLVLAACTAKLQQRNNNNPSDNPTTVDNGLQGGAAKRDSVRLEDIVLKTINYPTSICYYLDTTKEETLLLTPQNIFTTYKYLWNLGEVDSIILATSNEVARLMPQNKKLFSIEHYYWVYYKGTPIENNPQRLAISINGKINSVAFFNWQKLNIINPNPTIDIDQALDSALLKSFPANTVFRWPFLNAPRPKQALITSVEKLKADRVLFITFIDNEYRLVYSLRNIAVKGQREFWEIIVDAHTGKVLEKKDTNSYLCESCGEGNCAIPNSVSCNTNSCENCSGEGSITTVTVPTLYYKCQNIAIKSFNSNTCFNLLDDVTEHIEVLNYDPNFIPTQQTDPPISGFPIDLLRK